MKTLEIYIPPLVEVLIVQEDVVRTSLGGDNGELPVQPWINQDWIIKLGFCFIAKFASLTKVRLYVVFLQKAQYFLTFVALNFSEWYNLINKYFVG